MIAETVHNEHMNLAFAITGLDRTNETGKDDYQERLSEKSEVACGWGFWLWARRRVPSIPAAGCKERANEPHSQKHRRPEGFRVQAGCTLAAPGQTGLDAKTGCLRFFRQSLN